MAIFVKNSESTFRMNVEVKFGSVDTRDTYIEDVWDENLLFNIEIPSYLLR